MISSDTIAAIATAMGEASIAVVRVTGNAAVQIVNRVFKGRVSLLNVPTHTIWYGHIHSMVDNSVIDEVLVSVMRKPRSFTGEDTVEISTHGGVQAVQEVLSELLRAGARLAEPGEFTKRAFLNGRIDLTQAEGIMELISAQTKAAKNAALRQVEGSLSHLIRSLREQLLQLLALIEVNIDYPEHDEEEVTANLVFGQVRQFAQDIKNILSEANNGRILQQGIRLAIIGRPNVGKSSLLNQLARYERAIVTDIPGTTRDVIEQNIQIDGIPLVVVDTAGIRETDDIVEKIGVERSWKTLNEADLLILMIDQSCVLTDSDMELLHEAGRFPSIVLLSKSDMPSQVNESEILDRVGHDRIFNYSIFDPLSLKTLEESIKNFVFSGQMGIKDVTFIANSRQIHLLETADHNLGQVLASIEEGQTLDLVAVDLYSAWTVLGEIIGETPRDDLLDQIFSQFCLGK